MKAIKDTGIKLTAATVLLLSLSLTGAAADLPDIKVDNQPLDRNGPVLTSFAPIIKDVRKSVVSIETERKVNLRTTQIMPGFRDPIFGPFFGMPYGNEENDAPRRKPVQMGLGSGVIVSQDGYILTNNHVIDEADTIRVELSHTGKKYQAEVVGTDPATDVAVLKIDEDDLPSMTFADSDSIEIGDIVMAIGNPLGVGQTVTLGIVGATGRSELQDLQINYQSFIQTDAAINRGNSGGALVDAYGRLIGINTAIASPSGGSDGLGFAIPSNLALNVMNNLVKYGKMVRGYLGVLIQDVDPEMSDYFQLDSTRGALIAEVFEDSPADKAGLEDGDIVIAVNGMDVANKDAFRTRIAQTSPGEKVGLKVIRDGKEVVLFPVLDELDETQMAGSGFQSTPGARKKEGITSGTALEGLKLSELEADIRRQFNIPRNVSGVLVTGVDPSIASPRMAIEAGDIIASVHQIPVNSLEDVRKALDLKGEKQVLLKVLTARNGYRGTQYVLLKK